MNNLQKWIIATLFVSLSFNSSAQGCVAVRPMSCASGGVGNGLGILPKNSWQFSANYQYFKSFRHFRGDVEEHERIELGTQVENFSHAVELGVSYGLTSRLNVGVNLPYLSYRRTSLYEHYGNSLDRNPNQERFETSNSGIGDMRISANYWLFNPDNHDSNGNISLGLGLKLPTGNSNVQGEFHKMAVDGSDSIITKAVDQSIQTGDGGWGVILQFQAIQRIFPGGVLYANGFYMSNPMEVNNTLSRGKLEGVNPIIAYHSIPDQFSLRAGLNYTLPFASSWSLALGGRYEGVPSHDLIGSSNGYRRPGYIVSLEPSIFFTTKNMGLSVSVPTALYRNRVKSVYDLSDPSGEKHGDAAFADYLINFTFTYRLHPKK